MNKMLFSAVLSQLAIAASAMKEERLVPEKTEPKPSDIKLAGPKKFKQRYGRKDRK